MRLRLCLAATAVLVAVPVTPAWSAPVQPEGATMSSSYEAGQLVRSTPHTASTQFVVPAYTCPAGVQALDVGVGDAPTAANPVLFAGVQMVCAGGNVFLEPVVVAGGTETDGGFVAHFGDTITASVQQTTKKETATVTDATTGGTLMGTGKPTTPDVGLLFGVFVLFENGQPAFPVQFSGSIPFSHNMFNGQPLGRTPRTRLDLPILSWSFATSKLAHQAFTVTNTRS